MAGASPAETQGFDAIIGSHSRVSMAGNWASITFVHISWRATAWLPFPGRCRTGHLGRGELEGKAKGTGEAL